MRWTVITIPCAPEASEAVSHALLDIGCGGIVLQGDNPITIQGSLPVSDDAGDKIHRLRLHLNRLEEFGLPPLPSGITLHYANDEDWADAWKKHFHVTRYGERIVIKPSWEEYAPLPNDLILALDPGMAFGTGAHPTTRLCLQALEERVAPGMIVADVGTGSGILALAAARLGASCVHATDIDPLAREAATRNVAFNNLADRVHIEEMEVFEAQAKGCDLIVANIIAQIVIDLAPAILPRLKPGALFIASGIVEEFHDRVRQTCEGLGMTWLETKREDIWVCLVFRFEAGAGREAAPPLPRGNYPWAV
jgi:ribosomal protein L11 methyltransferase